MNKEISKWNLAGAILFGIGWLELGTAAATNFEGPNALTAVAIIALVLGAIGLMGD